MQCPQCETTVTYYFGKTVAGKQTFVCYTCGRHFTDEETR